MDAFSEGHVGCGRQFPMVWLIDVRTDGVPSKVDIVRCDNRRGGGSLVRSLKWSADSLHRAGVQSLTPTAQTRRGLSRKALGIAQNAGLAACIQAPNRRPKPRGEKQKTVALGSWRPEPHGNHNKTREKVTAWSMAWDCRASFPGPVIFAQHTDVETPRRSRSLGLRANLSRAEPRPPK